VAIRATSLRWLALLEWVGIAGLIVLVGARRPPGTRVAPRARPAAQPAPSSRPSPLPPVAYDALFRLPNDDTPRPAGGAPLDRRRWEERFSAVRGELDGATNSLAKAQSELEALAHKTESWQMAAPGAQPTSRELAGQLQAAPGHPPVPRRTWAAPSARCASWSRGEPRGRAARSGASPCSADAGAGIVVRTPSATGSIQRAARDRNGMRARRMRRVSAK
jgi:hypothetical protein